MKKLLNNFLYDKAGVFKLAILTSPLFIFGLVAKLYAAAIFAGVNFTTLFVPFVKYFTLSGGADPYTYFATLGTTIVFPYPQLMLYIMAIPGVVFWPLLSPDLFTVSAFESIIFHLPILVADIAILLILTRWLKNKHRELLLIYWLSPILFYINYVHSQLDAIPIALVFGFLYFLFKERWLTAALLLGAAIATKFHIIILVPLTLIYLWRKHGALVPLVQFTAVISGLFILINNSQLFSPAFQTIVFQNQEQFKIFDLVIPLGGHAVLYVIPLAYLLVVLHSFTFKSFNRDTFVMLLGFSFGILTLFIAPMPGWYYWVIPFFIYFAVKFDRGAQLNLYLITIAYFAYFATTPDADYWQLAAGVAPSLTTLPNLFTVFHNAGLPTLLINNLCLTALQAILFINVLSIYRRGLEESKKRKLYSAPYLIGLAGDSGSGKSTLANLLTDVFASNNVSLVSGDAMHKWERGNEMWQTYTHLNPRANQLHDDLSNIRALQAGQTVYRRNYDHHTGTFTTPRKLDSKKLVIIEGLHTLFLTHMQRSLDLKVFIEPEEQLRIHWKLCRDMNERGYTKDTVLSQLQKRAQDSAQYINVQAKHADITITLKCTDDLSESAGIDIPLDTFLEITCDNTLSVDALLSSISGHMKVEHQFDDRVHTIRFHGHITAAAIEQLSYQLTPELYDIVTNEPVWADDYNGILQLFLTYCILQSLDTPSYGQN